MMKIGIDTNILVRAITKDDTRQTLVAKNLITKYSGMSNSIFISDIVICELIWVLESSYKFTRYQLLETLKLLISTEEFVFSDDILTRQAVQMFENGNADFADYLNYLIILYMVLWLQNNFQYELLQTALLLLKIFFFHPMFFVPFCYLK